MDTTPELLIVFPIVILGFKQKFQTSISWAPPGSGPIQPQTSKITAITSKQEVQRNTNCLYDRTIDSMLNAGSNSNNNQILPRTFLVVLRPLLIPNKQSITAHNNTILQSSLDQLIK